MEQRDFLTKDELRTPKEEIDVRLVLAENAALKDEVAELKEQLAQLKKVVYFLRHGRIQRRRSSRHREMQYPYSRNPCPDDSAQLLFS